MNRQIELNPRRAGKMTKFLASLTPEQRKVYEEQERKITFPKNNDYYPRGFSREIWEEYMRSQEEIKGRWIRITPPDDLLTNLDQNKDE